MRIRSGLALALALACALSALVSSCAHNSAPRGWLSRPEAAQSSAFGSWLEIEADSARQALLYEGEFIGVNGDSIFVFGEAGFEGVPRARIVRARLTAYDARAGDLAGWTFLGTVGTLSHGVGLIITAPMWILVGSLATGSQSHKPVITIPKDPWREASKYARFPQGLPKNLDRVLLTGKR